MVSDGPFSRFESLSRILTVIEGAGVDLHTPDGVLEARPLEPVRFLGDLPVESRIVAGPIRDLNVIYDAARIAADVRPISGPFRHAAGPGTCGFLALTVQITADGQALPPGAEAFGSDGLIKAASGAMGLFVTLRRQT